MAFNKRERLFGILVLLCVLAFLSDRFLVTPLSAFWNNRAERIAVLEKSLEKAELLLDREDDIARRGREMRENSLPADPAAAEKQALNAVSSWAQNSRLDVTAVKPRWIADARDPARKVEFRISAEGDIEAVARFLYALESSPMALRAEDIDISSRDERGRTLAMNMRFTGLVQTEEKR